MGQSIQARDGPQENRFALNFLWSRNTEKIPPGILFHLKISVKTMSPFSMKKLIAGEILVATTERNIHNPVKR